MTDEQLDLRLAPAALAAWATAAWGLGWTPARTALGAALLLTGAAVSLLTTRGPRLAMTARGHGLAVTATLVVAASALAVAGLRAGVVQSGPVAALAQDRAEVALTVTVASDPVRHEGQFAPSVIVRLMVTAVTGRGVTSTVHSPVLAIADLSWLPVRLGEHLGCSGRLAPADSPDLAAVLLTTTEPTVLRREGWVYRGVAQVREGLAEAASPLPAAEASLVPALVDGDDSAMPEPTTTDFKTTGLTHLLAVSGSNLTLVLGFVLFVARWAGVRGRWLVVVGLAAVVFFVLLARPQPSVLRAAAMGVVALVGLSSGGRRRGMRALCVAVVVLVLVDPWLARSVGFVLSTLATTGILLFAGHWRDAMSRCMPALLAEALAVPLSAQLACTPAIAAVSGQVSLVAVVANLVVAPAVGPTTVAGLVAGLLAVPSTALGHVGGRVAGLPAWWIVTVAQRCARLPGASFAWPAGALALVVLTLACLALLAVMTHLLRHRWSCLAGALLLVVAVVHPLGRPFWPPTGWLLVVCDVGQGDGLVINAGRGAAVVVDAGPDPVLIDACLDRLHVATVPLVVLSHFHADHVDGLAGVLEGRSVSEIEVSPYAEPASGAAAVRRLAAHAGIPVTVAVAGETRTVGRLSWAVLGPLRYGAATGGDASAADEGSGPNNASIVMMLAVEGHRILLSGDAEPEEQQDIVRSGADLRADIVKVAHHGSANQDRDFVAGTHAAVALISVGADNDYGHPAQPTLALLGELGARVFRTDLDGDVAVVVRSGGLAIAASR
jgi:competence protein ComEC